MLSSSPCDVWYRVQISVKYMGSETFSSNAPPADTSGSILPSNSNDNVRKICVKPLQADIYLTDIGSLGLGSCLSVDFAVLKTRHLGYRELAAPPVDALTLLHGRILFQGKKLLTRMGLAHVRISLYEACCLMLNMCISYSKRYSLI